MSYDLALPLIFIFSIGSLFVAGYLISWVLKKDTGTPAMREISNAIKEGAEAFLRRQNTTILLLATLLAALIFVLYAFVRTHHDFDPVPTALRLAFWTTLSFVLGAGCSVIAGYIGMWISIRSNIRTASAARSSLNDALRIALRGGAVSGLFVVAMSLFGVGGLYWLVSRFTAVPQAQIPLLIVGYGFGASFVALFAQLGGGIYTKAADVGADLVGKVEAGIPEDDPRNPAVIADLVGDNVGDCAGRGADLFESTAAENIGAMILGATLAAASERAGMGFAAGVVGVMLFPLVARAFGLLASIVGIFFVHTREDRDPMQALNRGYYVAATLAIAGFFVATRWLLYNPSAPDAWWKFFICGIIGVLTSVAFVYITQYYTEYRYRPVREIAEASQTGPATNVIAGIVRRASSARCCRSSTISVGDPRIVQDRSLGSAGRRTLRDRGRDDGHARNGRLHPRDGHVRADHGQRRRNRRDVPAARGDPPEDGPPGLGRQHDQGPDEGIRDRVRGARRFPPLLGVPRRAQELRGRAPVGQHRETRGLRGRAHRSHARVLLLGSRDPRGRQGRGRRDPGRAGPVPRASRDHAGDREAGLRPDGGHRDAGGVEGR